jgi:hypothetical protein
MFDLRSALIGGGCRPRIGRLTMACRDAGAMVQAHDCHVVVSITATFTSAV